MTFRKYKISTDALMLHEKHLESLQVAFASCDFKVIPNQYTDLNGNEFIFCLETDEDVKFFTEVFHMENNESRPSFQFRSKKFSSHLVIKSNFEFKNKSYSLIGELGRGLLVYCFQDEDVYTCSFSDLINLGVLSKVSQ